MAIKRKRRLPDGSLGPLESVTGLPQVDPQLVMALEAIAMQNELIFDLHTEIEQLKSEVNTLKGGGA